MSWTTPSIRLTLCGLAALACRAQPAPREQTHSAPAGEAARIAFSHQLPPLDGSRLVMTLVEVSYAPGAGSPAHSHPCAVIGHVISGALRTRINDEPEMVYHAGESFYEAPDSRHLVSANASSTEAVRFLAYFTCDRQVPLSSPIAAERGVTP